jgi:predicted methyltransferase
MLNRCLIAVAILAMPLAAANAAPADVAAAVSAPGRPAEAVALDAVRKPVEILRFMGLERGDRTLDLFTGTGYYAEIIGRAVGPSGSVFAWEPANFLNDESRAEIAALRRRQPNVAVVAMPANAVALPENAFDFAMMHLNYHDAYWESARYNFPRMDPPAFLQTLYRSMKPGGTVAVIDHVANPGRGAREEAAATHRIDPATIRADFERAGFVLDGESDMLRNPADDRTKLVFDPSVRGRTDRVVYRFRRPAR